MDKEKLVQKISQLLSVSDEESEFAFKVLKEKLVAKLKVGEAIRIDDLGVFQLKEQMTDHLKSSGSIKKTLVYSPSSNLKDKDALFLTLDVDENADDLDEFSEKVFQVGVNRPMITLHVNENEENSNDPRSQVVKKINQLVDESDKISNFDLWDDYLGEKESTSMLDNDNNENDDFESLYDDDETDEPEKHIYENDFEELNEEDILNELMDDGNLDSEQLKEITTDHETPKEFKPEEIIEPEESDELTETDFEPLDDKEMEELFQDNLDGDTNLEESTNEDNFDDIKVDDENFGSLDLNEEDFAKEDLEENIEENFPEDLVEKPEEIIDEQPEPEESQIDLSADDDLMNENFGEEKIPEDIDTDLNFDEETVLDDKTEINEISEENGLVDEDENQEELQPVLEGELPEETEKTSAAIKPKNEKKQRSPVVTLIISLLVMIAIVAMYYLFFNNNSSKKNESNIATAQQEEQQPSAENETPSTENVTENNGESAETATNTSTPNDENKTADQSGNSDKAAESSEQKAIQEQKSQTAAVAENTKPPVTKANQANNADVIMVNADPYESEVSDNIYYNGKTYSVQVSSWKHKSYAENEVKKLLKKGFSAFIVKAYVKKFNGTWHRVRIGPYSTLGEAQTNQAKLK